MSVFFVLGGYWNGGILSGGGGGGVRPGGILSGDIVRGDIVRGDIVLEPCSMLSKKSLSQASHCDVLCDGDFLDSIPHSILS